MRISPWFVLVMDSGISSCQNPSSGKLSHLPIQPTNTSERNPFHADRPRLASSPSTGHKCATSCEGKRNRAAIVYCPHMDRKASTIRVQCTCCEAVLTVDK